MGAGASVPEGAEQRAKDLYSKVDINNDGALVKSELVELCKSAGFDNGEAATATLESSCDANADGKVTITEWTAFCIGELAKDEKSAMDTLSWFEELADKMIAARSIQAVSRGKKDRGVVAATKELFAKTDKNSDGNVTKKELIKTLGQYDDDAGELRSRLGLPNPKAEVAALGTEATKEEKRAVVWGFKDALEKTFAGADADGDGNISEGEFIFFVEEYKSKVTAAPAAAEGAAAQAEKFARADGTGDTEVADVAPDLHVTIIVWNFLEQEKCDAWLNNFMTSDDGFPETAEAPGITVCRLYQSNKFSTSVGFYEEWVSAAAQKEYAMDRFKKGFMNKWFDVDPTTFKFKALRDVQPGDEYPTAVYQGTLLKGVATTGAKSKFALTTNYSFETQADCDAWLTHFQQEDDGFQFAAKFGGCNLCKLYKINDDTTNVGIYREWEDEEAYKKYEAVRTETGYFVKWFGLDTATSACSKLKHGKPELFGYTMLRTDEKDGKIL